MKGYGSRKYTVENFNQNCRGVHSKMFPGLSGHQALQSFQYYYVSKGFGSSRIRPTRFGVGGNQPNAVTAQDLNMMINNVCIIIKLSWLLLQVKWLMMQQQSAKCKPVNPFNLQQCKTHSTVEKQQKNNHFKNSKRGILGIFVISMNYDQQYVIRKNKSISTYDDFWPKTLFL